MWTCNNKDFARIRAFAFDVDGVFTDGGVFCNLQGELFRTFDSKDGFAIRMATMKGYPLAIITGGRSESITQRFLTCGVVREDIYLRSRNKVEELRDFCKRHNLQPADILYMGDDIPDVEVMKLCGIGACPDDAVEEAIMAADYRSDRNGGHGAVRDVIQKVLEAHGDWTFDVQLYKKLF